LVGFPGWQWNGKGGTYSGIGKKKKEKKEKKKTRNLSDFFKKPKKMLRM